MKERGIVNWFNASKGFGFITREDNKGDIFVHFQDIEMEGYKELKKDQVVSFEVEETAKGKIARHVKKLEG